jgi:hypothetical protein
MVGAGADGGAGSRGTLGANGICVLALDTGADTGMA